MNSILEPHREPEARADPDPAGSHGMARHGLAGFLRQGIALTAEAPQHAETQTRYIHMAAATAPLQKSARHHLALGRTPPRGSLCIRLETVHHVMSISDTSSRFGFCKSYPHMCRDWGFLGSASWLGTRLSCKATRLIRQRTRQARLSGQHKTMGL